MNFNMFSNELKSFPAFSLVDISKLKEKVYHHRLVDWQKNGYLKRVANGIYMKVNEQIDEMTLFYLANQIYQPSYVSLETAFSYYEFIPEAVYGITSVTTKKTNSFTSDDIVYSYRTINPNLFFGYRLVKWKNTAIRIAEPEKAILDFLYLNAKINSPGHIEEMRFNYDLIRSKIDRDKLNSYLKLFGKKTLAGRLNLFLKELDND